MINSRYAFYVDSASCSGCKACQAACKDKHHLPVGILWRRVYEIEGGGWTRRGEAWVSDIFAYYLSMACNHCEKPTCVAACPAAAITQRSDGIVLIDSTKCLGCQYCSWACPYDAPVYDPAAGTMTKCTFCVDDIERGVAPACVSACPMRAIEFGEVELIRSDRNRVQSVFPLPPPDLTEPSVLIRAHAQAARANEHTARLGNAEAVRPRDSGGETPLIFFTLLSQMACGTVLVAGVAKALAGLDFGSAFAMASAALLLALFASLFHLGTPHRAWHALTNVKSSWLSREILFALLFAGACWFGLATESVGISPSTRDVTRWLAAILGLGLVFTMANAYRLPTIRNWNSPLTVVTFFDTMFILGGLLVCSAWALDPSAASPGLVQWILVGSGVAVLVQGFFTWRFMSPWGNSYASLPSLRLVLLGIAALAAFVGGFATGEGVIRIASILAFAMASISEVIGRWVFYEVRKKGRSIYS